MTPGFRNLLNRYAMAQFERQLVLCERFDTGDWVVSPKDGTATVAGKTFRIQVLGSSAEESNTWRWAWAAAKGALPATVLEAAKKVRNVGRKRAIAELAEEQYPLAPLGLDAHTVAMVATAVAELPVYWRFKYPGGTLFAALEVPDFKVDPLTPERLAQVARGVCERLDVDHNTALSAYVAARGLRVEGGGAVHFPDGAAVIAKFDADGKLTELRTPPPKGAGRRPDGAQPRT